MSSITNVTTGDIEIVDPLAIAYQAAGVDVPVTAATPLPITGTITTTQGPVQYVDAGGTDVEVKEGVRPLPVSVEAIVANEGPIEFKNAAGADTVVKAGNALTALPINAEGGTIDTVSTVTSVTDVANVQSVDLVDAVTTVGTVTSVTNVVDVDSVNLVDAVTLVNEVSQSNGYHLSGAGAWVENNTNVNRGPVTERGISSKAIKAVALDVGPGPGIGGGGGVVYHTAATWERISHIGIGNLTQPGEVSLGIVDPGTGMIVYSGELRVMASASLPGVASVAPREYSQPFNIAPGTQLAIWHSLHPATCDLNFLLETLE